MDGHKHIATWLELGPGWYDVSHGIEAQEGNDANDRSAAPYAALISKESQWNCFQGAESSATGGMSNRVRSLSLASAADDARLGLLGWSGLELTRLAARPRFVLGDTQPSQRLFRIFINTSTHCAERRISIATTAMNQGTRSALRSPT
jgi:hypothetical protein